MKQNTVKLLSIVIPLYNEAEVFSALYKQLSDTASQLKDTLVEFVFIDDGSSDSTWDLVASAQANDPRIRAASFSRNFGQQVAFSAGLDLAVGDAIVLMDGDLQDDPAIVNELLNTFRQGYDVVSVRRQTREASPVMKLFYTAFYRTFHRLSPLKITLDSGDFSIISGRVRDCLRAMPEPHRFLRGMRSWVGFRQTAIDVSRPARKSGRSKFTFSKLCGLAADGLLSFSIIPLRLSFIAGMFIVAFAFLMSAYWLYIKLSGSDTPTGFTAIICFVCLIGGANLFFIGIIGEYVGRIYEQGKHRPLYIVREFRGVAEEPPSGVCPQCRRISTR